MAPQARKCTTASTAKIQPPRRPSPENRKTLLNAEYDRELETAPRARRRVATELRQAGCCTHLVDDAELLVCELVANAVRYGAGPKVAVALERFDGGVWIAVDSDPGETRPVVHEPSELDERGRGLFLVKSYAAAFGNEITPSGAHRTWCLLNDPHPDR